MVDLVIIYNHKYEANISRLDHYYKGRFNKIWHLMPFYGGDAAHVIPVYDNSFRFQNFVAQAAGRLKQSDATDFLFVGDDLLLNPKITQDNMSTEFGIKEGCGFIEGFYDISKGLIGVGQAREVSLCHRGLEISKELPSFEEALKLIERHIKLESLTIRKYKPCYVTLKKPLTSFKGNWWRYKGNIWRLREQVRNWLNPKRLEYPVVAGCADIFSVPRKAFDQFAHYCGVFASAQIFVELALPTALALSCENIVTEDATPTRGLNVWFPPGTWDEHESKKAEILAIENQQQNNLSKLIENWPSKYLYLHPVKLSNWK